MPPGTVWDLQNEAAGGKCANGHARGARRRFKSTGLCAHVRRPRGRPREARCLKSMSKRSRSDVRQGRRNKYSNRNWSLSSHSKLGADWTSLVTTSHRPTDRVKPRARTGIPALPSHMYLKERFGQRSAMDRSEPYLPGKYFLRRRISFTRFHAMPARPSLQEYWR